jgi:DNA-binding transcriptional ArsR family regulator
MVADTNATRALRTPEPLDPRERQALDPGRPSLTRATAERAGAPATAAPLAAAELDRIIHERMRLGIVSALAVHDALTFTDLRDLLGASDGNLSVHARKLEDAGYVACDKSFEGRIPKTQYRLTDAGRTALAGYLDHMESIIRATRAG